MSPVVIFKHRIVRTRTCSDKGDYDVAASTVEFASCLST